MLGGLVGVVCCAGILMAQQNGVGYWVKTTGKTGPGMSLFLCVVVAFITLPVSFGVCRWYSISVNAFSPVSMAQWGEYFSRTLIYSFGEEVFYRGWVQAYLGNRLAKFRGGKVMAIFAVAILFAVQHVGGLPVMIIALVGGLIFGAIFEKQGLLAAAAGHCLANLLQAMVLPLLVN